MINIIFLISSFLFSTDKIILSINNIDYTTNDFISQYPRKHWINADSLKRGGIISDFIKRELCILESENLYFKNDPEVSTKIRNRSKQILVNESYEHFVASPLIQKKDLENIYKFAAKDIYAEGLILSLCNLMKKGKMNKPLFCPPDTPSLLLP